MHLRGVTAVPEEIIEFSMEDAPIMIATNRLALSAREHSPLIKSYTVGRVHGNLAEGDIVVSGDRYIGYVIYSRGFKILTIGGAVEEFEAYPHTQLLTGDSDSMQVVCGHAERNELLFSYKGRTLKLQTFLGRQGNYVVSDKSSTVMCPRDILYNTGFFREAKKSIYFGEILEGGEVVLQDTDVAIMYCDGQVKYLKEDLVYG